MPSPGNIGQLIIRDPCSNWNQIGEHISTRNLMAMKKVVLDTLNSIHFIVEHTSSTLCQGIGEIQYLIHLLLHDLPKNEPQESCGTTPTP